MSARARACAARVYVCVFVCVCVCARARVKQIQLMRPKVQKRKSRDFRDNLLWRCFAQIDLQMKHTEHYKILQKARGFQISLLIKWKFQRM